MPESVLLRDLPEYARQRVVVFIDGQNLYHRSKKTFGHPLCHPHLLAEKLADGRRLIETRFYTGIHDPRKRPEQHGAMDRRLKAMQSHGVTTITRRLSYVSNWVPRPGQNLPDANEHLGTVQPGELLAMEVGAEKGIDLALGLDLVRYAREGRYDVAVLVSRDRDLHEAAEEVHRIGTEKQEVLVVELVLPVNAEQGPFKHSKPYDGVRWLTRPMFDACIDTTDYSQPLGGTGPSGAPVVPPVGAP